ncbi:hypothetical protein KP509_23G074500 [Ceratopteris richardii]|uniref:Unsaturated rhamnogalacturonyl hydrolase n=1 Tax=Ceratopteris richardii TaxID=49495 RepID=A0A8T2S111_CERRI|nr:hypothetical protein KP509_23G074500 [Ceratopteris richardii]
MAAAAKMQMYLALWLVVGLASFCGTEASRERLLQGTQPPLYVRMADTALQIWNSSGPGKEQWNYERGVLLYGIQEVWKRTNDAKYLEFVQNRTDAFLEPDGSIPTYKMADYNLDNIRSGTILLFLWKLTGETKYKEAADLLREQLKSHPRTEEGGFWHKQIYPYQMWLDGLFMAEPFYAEYAKLFDEPDDFDDIVLQFKLMEEHARDPETGLLYHGYDESRQMAWADPETGTSPSFWGRSVGWYFMGLVDTLDFFPKNHPERDALIGILQRLAEAVAKVQDPQSAVWWEVLDQGGREGNYLESSASCMFVYAYAKAVKKGFISGSTYKGVYETGFAGIQTQFVQDRPDGGVDLNSTVSVGGLGGDPYRNGTYEYYLSEAVVTNDAKGVGPFLLASLYLLR